MQPENNAAGILARVDRSSADKLLASLAKELVLLHEANQALAARIAAIEAFQAISDQVLESNSGESTELAESVSVDAAFSLSAENGFYGIEYDSQGVPYRWTGPEHAFYFELLLDRSSEATLTLRFLKIFMNSSPDKVLRCFVDGQPVAVQTQGVDGEFEASAALPPRRAKGGTIVMFLCPCLRPPLASGASQDTRSLGLAFRWLKVGRAVQVIRPEIDIGLIDSTSNQNEDVIKLEPIQTISIAKRISNGQSVAKMNRS